MSKMKEVNMEGNVREMSPCPPSSFTHLHLVSIELAKHHRRYDHLRITSNLSNMYFNTSNGRLNQVRT